MPENRPKCSVVVLVLTHTLGHCLYLDLKEDGDFQNLLQKVKNIKSRQDILAERVEKIEHASTWSEQDVLEKRVKNLENLAVMSDSKINQKLKD